MHKVNIETSRPLQGLRDFMLRHLHDGATTKEIADATGLMSVSTWLSHLKQNGFQYRKEYQGKTANGNSVYRYWLLPERQFDEKGQGMLLGR